MSDVGGIRGINSLIVRQGAEAAGNRQAKSRESKKPLEAEEGVISRDVQRLGQADSNSVRGLGGADVTGRGIMTNHAMQHMRTNVEKDIASQNLSAMSPPQPSALANSYGKAAAKGKIPPFHNASSGGLIIK